MSWQTVPICEVCWVEQTGGGRVPVRVKGGGQMEVCHFCRMPSRDGIYVRTDKPEGTRKVMKVELHGITLWMYRQHWLRGHGPLMPSKAHDRETQGKGISYAFLYPDGSISKHGEVIGQRRDLRLLAEEDAL